MGKKDKGGGGGGGGNGGNGGGGGKGKIKDLVLTGTIGDDFLFADSGNDLLSGLAGNDRLFGLEGNDTLDGGADHDELWGGNDADILQGGAGDDFLAGGMGSDDIDGGAMVGEVNTASFEDVSPPEDPENPYAPLDGITLTAGTDAGSYTSTNATADGLGDTDTLTNIHKIMGSNFDDHMTGGAHDDFFFGAYGFDTLIGGAGDDTLFGGLDDDVLEGGSGADLFVFVRQADGLTALPGEEEDAGVGDGADIILDFEKGIDSLLFLSNEPFAADAFVLTPDDALNPTQWVLTYQAEPDFFGPSEITIFSTAASLDVADLNIAVQIDADFHFVI